MTMCLLLAQVPDVTPQQQQSLMLWGFILMGAVVAGSFGILLIRRWIRNQEAAPAVDAGFSLSELRAMRDRGEITPEEYEQTRARVISKVKASANAPRPKRDGAGGMGGAAGGAGGTDIMPPTDPDDDGAR